MTTRRTITAGGVAVCVEGDGPQVLLVHGIPGSAATWRRVVPRLVSAGCQTITADLLGFGGSARPTSLDQLGIAAQAAALREVLSEFADAPVIAAGHDYGVPICVSLAHQWPEAVSGLVVAAGNVFTDTPIPVPLSAVNAPLVGGVLARMIMSRPSLQLMLRIGTGHPHVVLDAADYLGDRAQQRAIAAIFSASLRDLRGRFADVEAAAKLLRSPAAVLWGGRDPFFSLDQARRTASVFPRGSLSIEPDAGHFLPEERPDAFVAAVRRLQHDRGTAPA